MPIRRQFAFAALVSLLFSYDYYFEMPRLSLSPDADDIFCHAISELIAISLTLLHFFHMPLFGMLLLFAATYRRHAFLHLFSFS